MKTEKIKDKMRMAIGLLISVNIAIDEENKDGKQFDFCTDSKLSDLTDNILRLANKIDKTVYQKR